MIVIVRSVLMAILLAVLPTLSLAAIDVYEFDSDQQAQAFKHLTLQLRCPKCQNNSIADSNAPIAMDMRTKVYQMMKQGQSDQQIIDYMVARYGHFVTYDPPVNGTTLILWAGPILFLLIGSVVLVKLARRRPITSNQDSGLSDQQQARLQQLLEPSANSSQGDNRS